MSSLRVGSRENDCVVVYLWHCVKERNISALAVTVSKTDKAILKI